MKASLFCCTLIAVVAVATTSQAITIASAPFSLGYGWTGASFNTTETSGANTATTIGNFTFTPAVTATGSSGAGPQFLSRLLTDGNGAFTTASADSFNSNFSVAATYTGSIPVDASDVQISINISQLSLYTAYRSGFGSNTGLGFTETTAGHAAASSILTGITSTASAVSLSTATNYKQLLWNPADYFTSGTNFTRTFKTTSGVAIQYAIDGFEILGTVEISYQLVPEPTTMFPCLLGAMALLSRRRAAKRNVLAQQSVQK